MRVTEGDLVKIRVINSNENTHAHSLYTQSAISGKHDAFTATGQPGGTIARITRSYIKNSAAYFVTFL